MWPGIDPEITIRESTLAERTERFPPLLGAAPPRQRIPIPKWVVVTVEYVDRHMHICSTFGLPQGGDTREEAVFWAERFASKNGYRFVRPDGWDDVEGRLAS